MIPHFAIIVGAMKCGTTSLFNYLADHPEVAPSRQKEPNFFSDEAQWSRGFDWYEDLFPFDAFTHTVALEASTAYTKVPYKPECAERIASLGRPTKIIYIIRDPIARIQSHYTMARARRWEVTGRHAGGELNPKVIAFSRYATQIEPYYRHFEPTDIKILLLEDLHTDSKAVLADICRFLQIDPDHDFGGLDRAYRATGRMTQYPAWYRRLIKAAPIRRLAAAVPGKRWVGRRLLGLGIVESVVLSQDQKEQAWRLLEPELTILQERYGVDTSRWRAPTH